MADLFPLLSSVLLIRLTLTLFSMFQAEVRDITTVILRHGTSRHAPLFFVPLSAISAYLFITVSTVRNGERKTTQALAS